MGKLDGKVAVITGGSKGIGLATAKLFVTEGAYVFVVARRQKELDAAVATLGANATGVRGDISNDQDLDRYCKADKGSIDVLFACAGMAGREASICDVTRQDVLDTYGTNVFGTYFTVQKALTLFNKGGSVILNGSIVANKPFPGYSVYSTSKAVLPALARRGHRVRACQHSVQCYQPRASRDRDYGPDPQA